MSKERINLTVNERKPSSTDRHEEWYHGSPSKLTFLKSGSFVTPFAELAKSYSHKPKHLEFSFTEDTDTDEISVAVSQDGQLSGYIYQVFVSDIKRELSWPSEEKGPLAEEFVTTKDLFVECFGEKIKVRKSYEFKIDKALLAKYKWRENEKG